MSASTPLRILIVGATGTLGSNVLNGFLQDKYKSSVKVSVLQRPLAADATEAKKAAHAALKTRGVTIITGDVSQSEDRLVPLLKGIDVVLVAVSGPTAGPDQIRLIGAAKKASVKWFVPSEFGSDVEAIGRGSPLSLFDGKLDVREAIKASGLDYTYVESGVFSEYVLSPFLGVDVANKTLTVPITPSAVITTTALVDIGALTADAIVSGRGRNKVVRFGGSTFNFTEFQALLERVTGGAPWKQVIRSKAELEAAIAANPADLISRFALVFGSDVSHSTPIDQTYNYINKIPTITLEEFARNKLQA